MKHFVAVFLFIFFKLINCSYSQNITDSKGLKQGKWSKKDESGRLKYEGQFMDNKPYGTFIYYHENGKQKAVSTFFDDGTKTHTIKFNYSGIREAEGNFLNQQKDSIWLFFDATGKTIIAQESYKSNKKDGTFISYFKDGTIIEILNYKNDKKHGSWLTFYEEKKPRIEAKYLNGELDSIYNVYNVNGTKKIEGKYTKANKDGNWFFYTENGTLSKQEMYKLGKLSKTVYFNGTFKIYYSDEVLKEVFSYKDGKKAGPYFEYYNNGKFVKKTKTTDDGAQEVIEVLEGQTVKCKGQFENDKKVGKFFYYKENGKLDKEENFDK